MSAEEIKQRSIKPLAKIIAWAQVGCDPTIMGIGPVGAVEAVVYYEIFSYFLRNLEGFVLFFLFIYFFS